MKEKGVGGMKIKRQFFQFCRFLLLPTTYSIVLAFIAYAPANTDTLMWAFITHFFTFFALFIARAFMYKNECLFKSTASVPCGGAIGMIVVYVMWCGFKEQVIQPWAFALYFVMLFITNVALFAYAVALKAYALIKQKEGENKKS